MADITVTKGDGAYDVTVSEGGGLTHHRVSVSTRDYERLRKGEESPEDLVKRSFQFLLTKEGKESILASFDLTLIGRYFPDYETTISS